jgi:hypothetical protein
MVSVRIVPTFTIPADETMVPVWVVVLTFRRSIEDTANPFVFAV